MNAINPRNSVVGWVLLMALLIGAFVVYVVSSETEAAHQVLSEDEGRVSMIEVAEAQRAHLAQAGRYAWISELEAAGLLGDDLTVEVIDGTSVVRTDGYRIDVLLPLVKTAKNLIRLGIEGEERANAPLAMRHFVVVARPLVSGTTGYRLYYVDETGDIWLSEGVSDQRISVRTSLQRIHLTAGTPGPGDTGPILWVRERDWIPR